ncbi:MAG: hypothetical protein A2430_02325 [Candidatus Liptonbacteria bacterium RIFOXYC1_FULL_36_8]|nr:MAG: hypothetical protein A2430_02325 [Candidatus Liptonbacteria bacterium RIFOXYC1_FULL_36_8]
MLVFIFLEVTIVIFFLTGCFILQGLRKIPADPPCIAVRVILGKRQKESQILKEGWHFFPFYPFWHSYIKVNITKKNKEFILESVRTPDSAELKIPVAITYSPGISEDGKISPQSIIDFLNSGGENGVEKILEEMVKERIRAWAGDKIEGPQSWKEALAARWEAVDTLMKALTGSPNEILSSVPTSILRKALKKPSIPPEESEEKIWGKNWEKVNDVLEKENYVDESSRKPLVEALKEREKAINSIRTGNGSRPIISLGITINRLNIGEIKILGKLAEAAEKEVVEKRERDAETVEFEHVRNRAKEIMDSLVCTHGEALELIQTERGKVKKEIKENKFTLSPETGQIVKDISEMALAAFSKGGKKP